MPAALRARVEQGLPLQPIETNGPEPRLVSWEELDRALREAIPSILY